MKTAISILFSILCLTLFSCQNEVDKFEVNEFIAPGEYDDALTIIQDRAQTEIINNTVGGTIELERAILKFEPTTFIDQSGEAIDGDVQISFVELIEQKDFIKYDLSTEYGDNKLLSAAYMLNIMASKNGKPLFLNPQAPTPIVYVLDENPRAISLFNSNKSGPDQWWEKSNAEVKFGAIAYEVNGMSFDAKGYEFSIENLNWVSIQRELQISGQSQLCLKLPDSNTPNNTQAFIMYDNVNSCQRLLVSSSANCAMTNLPLEFEGKIVIISHKGELNGREHIEAESRRLVVMANMPNLEMMPPFVGKIKLIPFIEEL